MVPLLVAFAAGCALNLAATPLARTLARRIGLVDRPDGRRKLQSAAVPVAGGPALFVAVAAAVAAAALAGGWWGEVPAVPPGVVAGLLAGGLVICGVGVADDAVGLRGRYKLLGQCLAVGVVVCCGVVVERVHLFGWDVELGVLAVPATGVLLLGAVNALNLLDGMDGLLGSVGLLVCLTFGAMAAWAGQGFAAWVAFATAGALLGFLRYNLPPASVYLGDSGSMLVGLVVGVLAVHASLKGPATVALVAPACVLVVPILDTAAAIARRKLVGRSVFSTDRGHLHHCLQRRGLSRRAALAVVAAVGLAGAAGGAVCVAGGSEMGGAFVAAAAAVTLVVTRLFGHGEARLVLERARHLAGAALRLAAGRGEAGFAVQVQGTRDWRPVWERLAAGAGRLRVRRVRLDVDDPVHGESYHARLSRPAAGGGAAPRELTLIFPLEVRGRAVGQVEVLADRAVVPLRLVMGEMTDLVHELEGMVDHLLYPPPPAARPAVGGDDTREAREPEPSARPR